MSKQSAFNQELVTEGAYAETSGVLDQLNLPPGVVKFLRGNKKILQIVGAIVVILVVTISLYISYRTNRLESAASNLSLAMAAEGDARTLALEKVVTDFSGTPSALWATTELGHMAMKDKQFNKAVEYYSQTLEKTSPSNPMYGLLIFALSQAEEAGKNYDSAYTYYITLKGIEGYKDEGYLGMARVLEAQGKKDKAVSIYKEYLGSIPGESKNEQTTDRIQEKITRLRAQK
ncbi:MAG: tetratricopeptide repeat protein [Desulfocapsa sp.]|nr:tetratricopeptide repeat protein [Desulfocapsa sp.]